MAWNIEVAIEMANGLQVEGYVGTFQSEKSLRKAMTDLMLLNKVQNRVFNIVEVSTHIDWMDRLQLENGDHPIYKKNASGVYEHIRNQQRVRFRLAGTRGRPPRGVQTANPPSSKADWEQWIHIEGPKHPEDPRD